MSSPESSPPTASGDAPSTRPQALVAALQWGLVQAFVIDSFARLFTNYYRATTDAFGAPGWVYSVAVATPLALLVGGVAGYRWVTSGRGVTTPAAHRRRVVFVGALLGGWALAIVPELAFEWLLGDRLFTVPFFVLPTVVAGFVLAGAFALAYRVDPGWYRQRRSRLLGAVQGAIAGLLLGMVGFVAYGNYLAATRSNFSLDGGPGIVVAVSAGAVVGYVLSGRAREADRSVEFLVVLVPSLLGFALLTGVVTTALGALGFPTLGFGWGASVVLPSVSALVLAGYMAYVARTSFHRRFVGHR